MSVMLERAMAGVVLSAAIATLAWRAGSLSPSGALAAIAVGTASVVAGWPWGALLVGYFVVSTLLSRFRGAQKERRTGGIVEKGGARDAVQVLANGGVFALCALLAQRTTGDTSVTLSIAALGALAASTADTWATELGTLFGGTPRSLVGFAHVPPGTSGAVSGAGSLAMCIGGIALAIAAGGLGLSSSTLIVAVAGIAGALVDSVLGATVQERRRCPRCDEATERRVHSCGTPTMYAGGLGWMTNDAVNFVATMAGAAVAAALRVV